MTLKEAKQQLITVQHYFPNVKILFPKQMGSISQQMEFKRSDKYFVRVFLSKHSNLLSACISAHGSIQYAIGRDSGIETGKNIRSRELVNLLGLSDIKDGLQGLENRINNF